MKHTRVCDLFGIQYPIIQGGMAHISRAELAAAVSEAGALGLIGAATMTPDMLRDDIRKAKSLTKKPIGVNVSLLNPMSEDQLKVVIAEGLKIVFTSAGNPSKFTKWLKDSGLIVAHVTATVGMAVGAEKKGVDAIVCEGFEAGGHDGRDMLTTMTLTPQVVDAVKVPVIAAGGIMDARGSVAAFALGAEGVQLGTRFIAAEECNAHPNYKKILVEAGDVCTVFVGISHGPVRIYRNKIGVKLEEAERSCNHDINVATIGPGRGVRACLDGDVEEGMFNMSQAAGLVKDVKPAREIVMELVEGYKKVIERCS